MGGVGGLLVSLLLALEIHASGDCPAAADVQRQLGPLLGAEPAASLSDVATIRHDPDGSLFVFLEDREGRPIGDRRFPRAGACRDQLETVAVTLAIWEAQIHPEISLRLDRLSSEAPPPVTTPPRSEVTVVKRAAPPAPTETATWSLGAALGAGRQADSWAPAARIELAVGPPGGRWRGRFAAIGVGRHTLDVPPGQATWWRASASLGVDVDVARGRRWAAVLGGGAVGGLATISGSGFDANRSSRSLDAGGELRARVEWRLGRVQPWLGASLVGWLRPQKIELQGADVQSSLPRVEPMAALGADVVW
ncbi:MAG TPA: hypothetical protein VGP07_20770 [Polyangia bacterium]|jgi:hypothetical protein